MSFPGEPLKSFLTIMEEDDLDFADTNCIDADTEVRYMQLRLEGKTPAEALELIKSPITPSQAERWAAEEEKGNTP